MEWPPMPGTHRWTAVFEVEGPGSEERRCLSHEGSGDTRDKGSALVTKAVETQGECAVLVTKAVETQGTRAVPWSRRQWRHKAKALS